MESNKNTTQDNKTTGSANTGTTGQTGGSTTPRSTTSSGSTGQSGTTGYSGTTTSSGTGTSGATTGSATQTARSQANDMATQAQQAVTNAYDKTAETLSHTYDQAITYGRENPGKFALIAFGAGIGIGILLANSGSRSTRTARVAEPVVNALSQIAMEFLR
ncbi:MAG TPA: hypothetical protein VJQ56_01755 [Blastocatellia bacterium]|nr:hypothetical protein [Blastocatellia bacterium]